MKHLRKFDEQNFDESVESGFVCAGKNKLLLWNYVQCAREG